MKNHSIYCLVPSQAYSGEIEVQISNCDNPVVSTIAEAKFEYVRKTVSEYIMWFGVEMTADTIQKMVHLMIVVHLVPQLVRI